MTLQKSLDKSGKDDGAGEEKSAAESNFAKARNLFGARRAGGGGGAGKKKGGSTVNTKHQAMINQLSAYSPTGERVDQLVSGGNDGKLVFWDVSNV